MCYCFFSFCVPKLWVEFEPCFEEKMTCGIITCEINNFEIELMFVFNTDVIPCGLLGSKHQLTNPR